MCTMCSTLCTVQRAVHIHNPGNVKMKLITRRRSASATAMVALVVCCSLLGICEAKRAASSAGGLAGMGISISTVGFITFIALLIGYFLFSKSDHTDNRSSNNRVSAFQAAPAAGLGSGQGQSQGRTNIGKRDVYLSEPNLRTIAALGLTEQPAVVSISVSTEMESVVGEFAAVVKAIAGVATVVIVEKSCESSDSSLARRAFGHLVPSHRFLTAKTEIGKIAIVRQLNPNLHIEYEASVSEQLCAHVRVVLLSGFDVNLGIGRAPTTINKTTTTGTGGSAKKSVWRTISSIQDLLR